MIGLFDSGVGGLTVLYALEQLLPNESFIYFSDSAHFPYGKKSTAELIRYTSQITAFLLSHNIEMLVIPCHTASALALPTLRANFPIPMIGMIEPTVKALKGMAKNQRIALMATEGTINSGIYQAAIKKELPGAELFTLTYPQLEQKIEQGEQDTQELIKECLRPILGKKIDVLVLACTHYPHVRKQIEEELDSETVVLDPSFSIAQEVSQMIKPGNSPTPKHLFYTSGDLELFQKFLNHHPPRAPFEVQKIEFSNSLYPNSFNS